MTNLTRNILAIDQGTTSSRAMIFDENGRQLAVAQKEFRQIYPKNGWVEHDPEEIWNTTFAVCKLALKQVKQVSAIGITNQRETTIIWDRKTGKPIYNAIVWQDRRTAEICRKLKTHEKNIAGKTGLVLDPYFSATKISWILENVKGARKKAENGELAFGTVDTFLLWRLTEGRVHATDATNASRTMIYNIHKNKWDDELLKLFRIPKAILPEVKNSADDFGYTKLLGGKIAITGIAGDQHAATIGQVCVKPGMMKSTYGTGCFVMVNTGSTAIKSKNKLLTTIAYRINGKTTYALEGSIFISGAVVQWLRDKLNFIKKSAEVEALIKITKDNSGIYLVPAFTGLGAPYWNPEARGAIFGLTRDSGKPEITRAALESVCYQTNDLIEAMRKDGITAKAIRVDGGMVRNNWLMQFLSDVTGINVARPQITETTALGAAYLAMIGAGMKSLSDIEKGWCIEQTFTAKMNPAKRKLLLAQWKKAVKAVIAFAE